jgi:MFS family permease
LIIRNAQAALVVLSLALAGLSLGRDYVPDWPVLRWANAVLHDLARVFERQVDPATLRFDQPALPIMLVLLLVMASIRILAWPARSTIIPLLLPPHALSNAITWNASAFEIATVAGPAIGGFIVAGFGFTAVYLLDAALGVVFCVLLARVRYLQPPQPALRARSWKALLAGAEFIWRRRLILASSTLDLFATLLGGAVAILPVYADRILHVGPIGLGWLRAAPSIGAFLTALWIAHRPPMQRPGRELLWAVAGFGAAIVVFGLSKWFWLSFIALLLTGVFDNISVVVRQTMIQLLTPDDLRGRVTGVNQIFIGSSNEIGAMRAGLVAALFGPIAAVVSGGIGTLLVVLVVARAVPALPKLPPLHTLKPEP